MLDSGEAQALQQAAATPAGADRASIRNLVPTLEARHGTPVTFGRFGGFYYAGKASRVDRKAVLLLGPIGFEEMCARTTWRALAEAVSASGHSCFRFDYPGTADAVDASPDIEGITDWKDAARECVHLLRACDPGVEIVLVGQGFGASLAVELGPEISDTAATVLMAPLVKGKSYLRELQAWTRVLTERIGIRPDPLDDNGYGVAGFPLTANRATAIRAIDLLKTDCAPAPHILLVERAQLTDDSPIGKHLKTLGADVSAIHYAGYEVILTDPTQAEPPHGTLAEIVAWIDALPNRSAADTRRSPHAPAPAQPIAGPHYDELPVRFGPDQRLFGVLCLPSEQGPSAVAILANAGRDYHIGWGRAVVEQARALAERGIASFRFDAGGIGDSPAAAGAPSEVIYSEQQIRDLRHAIDYVDSLDVGPITVVGRCSGAYAAFNAAVQDERVRHVMIINIERFVWDARESVEEALRYAHRSIGNFGATLMSKRGLSRLFSGELRVKAAVIYVSQRLMRQVEMKLSRLLPGLTAQGRLYSEVHRRFQTLENRGVRVSLVFSMGDLGLHEFRTFMGETGERLARYKKASVTMVADADHNFTHKEARARLTAVLCDLASAPRS